MLGLGIEVEEFLDRRTQLEITATLLYQERTAPRRVHVGHLVKQRLHEFGGWLGHVPSVPGLA